jgi:acyl-CoA thioester hydrolase
MENSLDRPIFTRRITVSESDLDKNGHVNNVTYLQWMQEIALEHYGFIGGTDLTFGLGATWVVREHRIEYLLPAYAGEVIEIQTWVENIRRVRSLRKYRFVRASDEKLLVRGETDWVFVDAESGLPRRIPETLKKVFRSIDEYK